MHGLVQCHLGDAVVGKPLKVRDLQTHESRSKKPIGTKGGHGRQLTRPTEKIKINTRRGSVVVTRK